MMYLSTRPQSLASLFRVDQCISVPTSVRNRKRFYNWLSPMQHPLSVGDPRSFKVDNPSRLRSAYVRYANFLSRLIDLRLVPY